MMNVLQSDHWMIRDVPIFLQRWQPRTSFAKAKHNKVLVWVKIHDIPLEAWSVEGIGRIASRIGVPLDMDTFTEDMCVEGKGRCAYARVLIKISADRPWEEYIDVQTWDLNTTKGVNHTLQLEYSWVPTRCDKCKVYDHAKSTCPYQLSQEPKATYPPPTAPSPTFNSQSNTDGYTVVNKRKRNNPKMRGRSRGPHNTSNKSNYPKPTATPQPPNHAEINTQQVTQPNKDVTDNLDTATADHNNPKNSFVGNAVFKIVNNATYVEDRHTGRAKTGEKATVVGQESTSMEALNTNNRYSSLAVDVEANNQDVGMEENQYSEPTEEAVQLTNDEAIMEKVATTHVVSQ
ncbi:hypothetical protein LXL04_001643 [Taraxacum kok-saghyz]